MHSCILFHELGTQIFLLRPLESLLLVLANSSIIPVSNVLLLIIEITLRH